MSEELRIHMGKYNFILNLILNARNNGKRADKYLKVLVRGRKHKNSPMFKTVYKARYLSIL